MNSNVGSGLITLESSYSVEDTVRRAEEFLTAKRVTLFAVIDHSGEADNIPEELMQTFAVVGSLAKEAGCAAEHL